MAEDQVLHSGDCYQIMKEKDTDDYTTYGIYLRAVLGEGVPAMSDNPADWLAACSRYQVQTLHLNYTGIRNLPAPLAQHHHLRQLLLAGNGLRDVPPVVFKLTTLTDLVLSENQLEQLPEDIYQLVNLQDFNLDDNPSLRELPPQMGHRLKQLRYFNCFDTGFAWEELTTDGHVLRGWQLARHGPGALPPHQAGELLIDCLVIYQEADKIRVTWGYLSICGQLEKLGHHCCTPASDVEVVRFGLQNCKVVVLCVGHSLPQTLLSEVKQSNRHVVVVTLYKEGIDASLKEQLSDFKTQIEYEKDENCAKLIQELNVLLGALPPQIVARGDVAIKVYQDAVQNGMRKDQRCRMLVVGAERIGKTSLINLLTGKRFDPEEVSTHLIDVVNVKASSATGTWDQTKDGTTHSEREYQLACKIAKKIKLEIAGGTYETKRERKVSVGESQVVQEPSKTAAKRTGVMTRIRDFFSRSRKEQKQMVERRIRDEVSLSHTELGASSTDPVVSEGFIKLVEGLLSQDLERLNESIFELSIWDFAGQGLYYTCHKIFLSSASIFILAFDLSKAMNEKAVKWVEDGFSNGQVLEFWLDSIYAYTKSYEPLSVLLVGTHAQGNQDKIENALKFIRNIFERKKHLQKLIKGKLNDITFFVENSCDFFQNDEAKRLKRYIEESVVPGIVEKRENQPMTWLSFEKAIKELQIEGSGENQFASLEQVKELAVGCQVISDRGDDEALLTILQFLHDIGSIIYYGKDDPALRDLVILQPEWLLAVLKKLILVPKPDEQNIAFMESWKILKEKHILTEPLMEHALDKFKETKPSLIKLMEKYDFICKRVRGEEVSYYVPFLLVKDELREGDGDESSYFVKKRDLEPPEIEAVSTATFYIDFKGFLPGGVFHQLVVRALQWSEGECAKVDFSTPEPEIYYRHLTANLDTQHTLMLDWMPCSQIMVSVAKLFHIENDERQEGSVCQNVWAFLERSLSKLLSTMGIHGVDYECLFDLRDYPQCSVVAGRCAAPTCRIRLRDCFKDCPLVSCTNPKHVPSRIDVSPIQALLKGPSQAIGQEPQAEGRGLKAKGIGLTTELSDNFLWDVSEALGADWEKVGYRLEMKKADIDRAKANHQFDMTKQAHSLLVQWRKQTPSEQNKRELLATALEKAGCTEIAEKHSLRGAGVPRVS